MKLKPFLKKEYLSLALSILAILILGVLTKQILVPLFSQAIRLRQELSQEEKTVSLLKEKVSLLSGIEQGTFPADFEKISQALPNDKDIFSLLGAIEGAGASSGVSLETFNLKPGESSTAELGFNLTVLGKAEQVKDFLANLGKARRLISLKKANLKFKEGLVEASIEGLVFYSPLPSKIGDIPSSLPVFSQNEKKVLDEVSSFLIFSETSITSSSSTSILAAPSARQTPFSF